MAKIEYATKWNNDLVDPNNTVTFDIITTLGAINTMATTNIGETFQLIWTDAGWAVIGRDSGATAGATAVAGLPVSA